MFYLILDILIYNYTPYLSYFFLLNINTKSYIYNLALAFLIDLLITPNPFYTTIFITIIYYLHHYLFKLNYHNFNIYYLINIITIILYYIFSMLIFKYLTFSNILNILIINSIFIAICYKKDILNIKCFR